MWPVFPLSQTFLVTVVIAALMLFAMRVIQPAWWSSRIARTGLFVLLGAMLVGFALWGIGESTHRFDAVRLGAGIAYVGVLTLLPAAIVMPFAAGADRTLVFALLGQHGKRLRPHGRRLMHFTHKPVLAMNGMQERHKVSRRAMIRFGAASVPAMAAATGASGFASAKRDPTMPTIRLRYPNLHPDLEGLRILHLSDLHLGACLGLDDLKHGLEIAFAARKPDLIVLTGDLADDPSLIPSALRLVDEANARYGALACLGNHEYLHDIAVTRPKYEAGPIPLLVGTGRSLRVGRATLFVGGADDPVQMHGKIAKLVTPSIKSAAAMAPAHADFRLLLCHRPEGFDPANENGFDLTLSGHTHGGQIGFLGRSLLEKISPDIGWWGTYAKARPREIADARDKRITAGVGGPSRLYTTSGFGHWFPFRVGCPTEMPLIVLQGDARSASSVPAV